MRDKLRKDIGDKKMKRYYLLLTFFLVLFSVQGNAFAEEGVFYNDEIILENETDILEQSPSNGILSITIQQEGNPFIPEEPIKGDLIKNAEPIYRIRYKVTAKQVNGKTVKNRGIRAIRYTGPVQGCKFKNINSSGVGYIDIDVRGAKKFTVFCEIANCGLRSNVINKTLTVKAEYQKMFYCTAYNTVLEQECDGVLETAPGIKSKKFPKDFLDAVKLNGSGKTKSGDYLHYNSEKRTYSYMDPTTATGKKPKAGRTIAVDPYYIPRAKIKGTWKRATVNIHGIGKRIAEDGGNLIKKYKIDIYMGEGKSVLKNWSNSYRKVTLEDIK